MQRRVRELAAPAGSLGQAGARAFLRLDKPQFAGAFGDPNNVRNSGKEARGRI
jgi:hypothetical protein